MMTTSALKSWIFMYFSLTIENCFFFLGKHTHTRAFVIYSMRAQNLYNYEKNDDENEILM